MATATKVKAKTKTGEITRKAATTGNWFYTRITKTQVFDWKRLKAAREKKEITQRGLAKKVGVSAPFLSDVERGRRSVSEKTAAKIISVLR